MGLLIKAICFFWAFLFWAFYRDVFFGFCRLLKQINEVGFVSGDRFSWMFFFCLVFLLNVWPYQTRHFRKQ